MISESIFKRSVLPNGIRLLSQDIEHINSISLGIWVNTGSRDETPSINGVSHLIEHMLFKGTRNRTALDIARLFDKMGGISNAFTTKDITCYYGLVLKENFDDILDLFSDMFCYSLFNQSDFEKEKQVVLQEIDMVMDNPEEYLFDIFYEAIWKNNPTGLPIQGKKDTVSAISQKQLVDFFIKNYISDNIIISVAGNLNNIGIENVIENRFKDVINNIENVKREKPIFHSGIELITKPLEQTIFIAGFEAPSVKSDNFIPLQILNIILGGNMSSLLFQEVREKRGLCYSIYSFISSLEDTGILGVYAGTSTENVGEIIKILYNQLEVISKTNLKNDILSEAKDFFKREILLSMENNESIMKKNARDEMYFQKFYSFDEYMNKIDDVTMEDIQKICSEILNRKNSLICLGNIREKHIKPYSSFFL